MQRFLRATGEIIEHIEGDRKGVLIELLFFPLQDRGNVRDRFHWREGSVKIGTDRLQMTLFVLDVEKFKSYVDYTEALVTHFRSNDKAHPEHWSGVKDRSCISFQFDQHNN